MLVASCTRPTILLLMYSVVCKCFFLYPYYNMYSKSELTFQNKKIRREMRWIKALNWRRKGIAFVELKSDRMNRLLDTLIPQQQESVKKNEWYKVVKWVLSQQDTKQRARINVHCNGSRIQYISYNLHTAALFGIIDKQLYRSRHITIPQLNA